MTIKTKLTLNVVIALAIVGAVAATSIISTGFVKNKLSYLTERSTPYQIKTVELQRTMQGATSDMIKLSASRNIDEYKTNRARAEQSLSDVENMQKALEALSGSAKIETSYEMKQIATELFRTIEEKLKAEDDAFAANKTIMQKLNDTANKLKALDSKVKNLQLNRSGTFMTALENTKSISAKLKNIQLIMTPLKDMQLIVSEIRHTQDRKTVIIAQGKFNTAKSNAYLNEYLKESKTLYDDVTFIEENIDELAKLKLSLLKQTDSDAQNRFDELSRSLSEKLSSVLLAVEQEILSTNERYGTETRKQENAFTQTNIATNILVSNSELLALGLSIEGLTTKLFTLISAKEVDSVEAEIKRIYEKIDSAQKSLEKELTKLEAKEEMKILQGVKEALNSVRGLLFAQDGVISKLRHKLNMDEKALQAGGKLREIVQRQSEKSKETVTIAQGEQEKAVRTLNNIARFSTSLIVIISLGAFMFASAFGTWMYRSISKPLNHLIGVSDDIAHGNLKSEASTQSDDEVGTVRSSMQKMVTNLRDIVGKITTATISLASNSEELSATAASLEKGSQEQALQVDQSAAAMTEMSQTITDIAKNASDTADAARKMKETAIHGKEAIDTTVSELNKFAEKFKNSASKVESLGNKSTEITDIVTLIKEIADQTNLLALNAAIEAAKAGEQGRGFAVVADNVRLLAEKTALATQNIANNVKTMETEIIESVNFMKEERNNIGKILDNIKNTLGAIDEIVRYVEHVTDMVQRIAVATDEQSTASESVSHNMENISSVTKQLSNSISEIKNSSGDLSHLAAELKSTAGWFRV